VGAAPTVTLAPIAVNGRDYGRIAIISNPLDELAEVWSDIKWLAAISLIVTFALLALVIFILRVSLSPFDGLRAGLAELEAGKAAVRIPSQGAAEFRAIADALNSLAETLDRVRRENRGLMTKLMAVHESERREIARDLHDEAGPVLFSIRASAVALQALGAEHNIDASKFRQLGVSIDRASAALQSVIRDLLNRLRLTGVGEGGLHDALMMLVAVWRERRPEVGLELSLPHDLSAVDETSSAAAYRIVQEGLTNVFRHSQAKSARVTVEFGCMSDSGDDSEEASAPALVVIVDDDGIGFGNEVASGLGLLGMQERVEAIAGSFAVESREGNGTRIRAAFPLPEDDGE
jgi:two-component system, NarL family, sensor histidine kinase UhpB